MYATDTEGGTLRDILRGTVNGLQGFHSSWQGLQSSFQGLQQSLRQRLPGLQPLDERTERLLRANSEREATPTQGVVMEPAFGGSE